MNGKKARKLRHKAFEAATSKNVLVKKTLSPGKSILMYQDGSQRRLYKQYKKKVKT